EAATSPVLYINLVSYYTLSPKPKVPKTTEGLSFLIRPSINIINLTLNSNKMPTTIITPNTNSITSYTIDIIIKGLLLMLNSIN
ncbi:hypothetical protein DER44DRAFT_669813, partial [Fusarium oxysporum]